MVVHIPQPSIPPDTRGDLGWGMEQFHHPRPVLDGQAPTPQRRHLMEGLSGRVLEIGAGDGVKLTCYPPEVDEIILVEPDSFLRETARLVGDDLSATVRVVSRLPVGEASCEAVVCSLVLCCAPDLDKTLADVRRALRPGGELRFYEHQRSSSPMVAAAETAVAPLWSRVCGGCHPGRDIVGAIGRAGFEVGRVERISLWHTCHVLGTAR